MKKILLGLIAIVLLSAVAGYFYFEHKFTPPPNQLKVSNHQDTLAIKWISNQDSKHAALLLPVKLKGISQIFYMQFDLGAHTTLFYEKAIRSISQEYPKLLPSIDKKDESFNFNLGEILISISELKTINYGDKVNWEPTSINIIGTLGSDLLEHKVVFMNFREHFVEFRNNIPNEIAKESIRDFEFNKRKVILNGQVNNENTLLYYDSGSSAFELITDKNQWKKLALSGAVDKTYQANSWGKSLKVHTIASNAVIKFGSQEISLNTVTYIEGTSFLQNLLMYFSGMGGMIGNKLFMDKILVLDANKEKFAVLD